MVPLSVKYIKELAEVFRNSISVKQIHHILCCPIFSLCVLLNAKRYKRGLFFDFAFHCSGVAVERKSDKASNSLLIKP